MRRALSQGTLSGVSAAAAAAALADRAHTEKQKALNREARAFTVKAFEAAGYRVLPSEANFVMVDLRRRSSGVQAMCRESGVIIARAFPPLTNYARISIGTMEEMRRAVEVMLPKLAAPASADEPGACDGMGRGVLLMAADCRSCADAARISRARRDRPAASWPSTARCGRCRSAPRRHPTAFAPRRPRSPPHQSDRARRRPQRAGVGVGAAEARVRRAGARRASAHRRPLLHDPQGHGQRGGGHAVADGRLRRAALSQCRARREFRIITRPRSTTVVSSASRSRCSAAATKPRTCINRPRPIPRPRKLRMRELRADWRGHTSEMLAKALCQESLDRADVDRGSRSPPRLVEARGRACPPICSMPALRAAGMSPRRVRATRLARVADPLALTDLIRTSFGPNLTTELALQMPMFQPVGGMDRIADALAARVSNVTLGAEVQAIEQPDGRVRVRYKDSAGAGRQIEGAYAICAMPLTVLRDLAVDVAPEMRAAIGAINYASAGKIGLQFKRRFWEEDEGIFGGITRTDLPITQILYPSTGFLSKKGVLVGYYQNGPAAAAMGELPPAERLDARARAGQPDSSAVPEGVRERLLDRLAARAVEPRRMGAVDRVAAASRVSDTLNQPDRHVYLCGDHLTWTSGWMAGAFESARSVVSAIHERASREASVSTQAAAAPVVAGLPPRSHRSEVRRYRSRRMIAAPYPTRSVNERRASYPARAARIRSAMAAPSC